MPSGLRAPERESGPPTLARTVREPDDGSVTDILDPTPVQPAHAATELTDVAGVRSLASTKEIISRYHRPGPHATIVLRLPFHGEVGDDLDKRWSATRTQLSHLDAPDQVLEHLDRAIEHLPRCGYHAVITADSDDAAYCWLTTSHEPVTRVGAHPALALALAEIDRRPHCVGAVVDRVGADLFAIDHTDIEATGSVDGESDGIHKSSGDGADQARTQRHSEQVWSRNALQVADALAAPAGARKASVVVVTCDVRASHLVAEHLEGRRHLTVAHANAGGRHEPTSPARLLAAAMEASARIQRADTDERVARVMEELGQHDRGVDGDVTTLQAIEDGRVKTLYVDVDRWTDIDHLDDTIKAATDTGADVVVGAAPALNDGIAAFLRVPYE